MTRLVTRVVAAIAALCFVAPLAAVADSAPLRITAVGDSITALGYWQTELDRLLTEAGTAHVIDTEAIPGQRCLYWAQHTAQILAHNPDLVIINCGTNDDRNQLCWGEPCTDWAYRVLIETIHNARPSNPIKIIPTFIGYSDPLGSYADDVLTREPQTNDGIYAQVTHYPPSWFAGYADIQKMPATATYLDSTWVHPTLKGGQTIGRIYYDTMQPAYGLPLATAMGEPVLCDMYGHRKGYPRPGYVPCGATAAAKK